MQVLAGLPVAAATPALQNPYRAYRNRDPAWVVFECRAVDPGAIRSTPDGYSPPEKYSENETEAEWTMETVQNFIAGRWRTGEGTRKLSVFNPATDESVAEGAMASTADVDVAVAAARHAARGWARTAPAERGAVLAGCAAAIAEHIDELARLTTVEMGKPLADARGGVSAGVGALHQYAELGPLHRGKSLAGQYGAADFVVHEPRGVVAVITPWNDPVAISCGLLAAVTSRGSRWTWLHMWDRPVRGVR